MDKVQKLLEAGITDRYVEGAVAADLIKSATTQEDKKAILKYLIENYRLLGTSGIPIPLTGRTMTSERWNELRRVEGKLIDAQIERSFYDLPTGDEVTKRLYTTFEQQPNDEMKDFFIANLLADSRVPYLDIPGKHNMVEMNDEQYKTLQKRLIREIRRIEFVINSSELEQRTQRASLLLAVLNSVSDPIEKVVLMSNIIAIPEREAQRIITKMQERM